MTILSMVIGSLLQPAVFSNPMTPPNPTPNPTPNPIDPKIDPRIEQQPPFPPSPPLSPRPSTPLVTPPGTGISPPKNGLDDPDLGILKPRPNPPILPSSRDRVEPEKVEPEKVEPDDDLGTIRIRPTPSPTPPPTASKSPTPKSLYLLGRLDYFHNSNVLSSPEKKGDGAFRSGLLLYYAPALGTQTFLLAFAEVGLLRYGTLSRLNSDELRLKVGIYHQWTPRVSTEVGWSYYQLGSAPEGFQQIFQGKRFFNEHSLRFEVTRQDTIAPALKLVTLYQFRWNLAGDVENYNRLVNTFGGSLTYQLSPPTQIGLDYYLTWTHFTQQQRDDVTHYLGTRLSHRLNDRLQLSISAGHSFGRSSESRLDFEGWVFGGGLSFNLPLL